MWDQEVAYYEKLAKESDRIDLQVLGKSTLGRPFIMLTISSPQNLAKLDRYKEISRQMADPRGLTPQQIDALAAEGRAVVLVTLGQHSTEVASAQMGPRLAHRMATRNDDQTRTILDNTIFLLIPSFNPDGHDIVGDWLKKSAGTPVQRRRPAGVVWRVYRSRQQSRRIHAVASRVAALGEGRVSRVVPAGL